MATRSVIGVMYGDVCKSVSCHWDGYLEGVGATLLENYGRVGASELVALGDISSLGTEIGDAHFFSHHDYEAVRSAECNRLEEAGLDRNSCALPPMSYEEFNKIYGHMTAFYGRDRDDEGSEFLTANSYQEFLEQRDGSWAEYYYIMGNDNQWDVSTPYDTQLRLLEEALEAERVADMEVE